MVPPPAMSRRPASGSRTDPDAGTLNGGSESDAEPELQHPRLIGDVPVERRLSVIAVALVGHVGTEVLVVEQVEHLEHAIERQAANLHALLQPGVHAMNRLAGDRRARQDGAVAPQPLLGSR